MGEITKELLLEKRRQLEAGREELLASIAANNGAIDLLDMLIRECDSPAAPEAPAQ